MHFASFPVSRLLVSLLFGALSACGDSGESGPVTVSIMGTSREIAEPLTYNATSAGRAALGATARGLVAFDAAGEVVPALAQRWIITNDGKSYIFRLRRARWADNDKVDAREVAKLLRLRINAATALDPYGNMAAVTDVLAMTTDVIEIRLSEARPNFLFMLAQPQMAISRKNGGTGPYRTQLRGHTMFLTPIDDPMAPPEDVDNAPEWRDRILRAERPAKAIMRFAAKDVDVVMGGTIADLPYVTLAEVDRKAVRIDPVQGLFGLAVTGKGTFLKDADVRHALSMAIDRDALIRSFALNGWTSSDTILPQQLNMNHAPSRPDWAGRTIDARRLSAKNLIINWQAKNRDLAAKVSIYVGKGPGAQLLFLNIAQDLRRIRVSAEQADESRDADLTLIDEVAPYDSAFWYLGRISCIRKVHCDPQGDELLSAAAIASDLAERSARLGEAEVVMQAHDGYIPLASPVRWSLVSRRLTGFAPSPRGYHPLNHLFGAAR